MLNAVLILPFLMIVGQTTAGSPATGVRQAAEMITIDGSKNPELIPQWALWEQTFNTLAISRRHGSTAVPASLNMPAPDRELVFEEALRQSTRRKASEDKVSTLRSLADKGAKPEVLRERNKEMIIEYRQATLDAGARLLERLSPEGRAAMLAWAEQRKSGITMSVPKGDTFYRLPY